MPEGDSILRAALQMRPVLVENEIQVIRMPQRRHRYSHWPEKLSGHRVTSIDTHGKNLFINFDNRLSIYSHLRMNGGWHVYRKGQSWKRSEFNAWLVMETAEHQVVQFRGPVLELMTATRRRNDPRLANLGPDVLADSFNQSEFLRRLRGSDPTRPFGDALLDQTLLAGLGNIWRAEACWEAQIDPWQPTSDVANERALTAVEAVIPRMLEAAHANGIRNELCVYGRPGQPCRRCQATIRVRGQGDDNRMIYWCPGCQS